MATMAVENASSSMLARRNGSAAAHMASSSSAAVEAEKSKTNPNTNGNASNGEADVEDGDEAAPEIDITINNVVCSFNVRCHLNLRDIALRGLNVEYRKENSVGTFLSHVKDRTYSKHTAT